MSYHKRPKAFRPVFLTIMEVIEIAALHDAAIAETTPKAQLDGSLSWHAVIRYPPGKEYVSDPDFSPHGYGANSVDSAAGIMDAVLRDLQGIGKFAPHWNRYDVLHRLLPHWRNWHDGIEARLDSIARHGT